MTTRALGRRSGLVALALAASCALGAGPAAAAEPTVTTFPNTFTTDPVMGPITGGFDGGLWAPTATGLIAFDRTGAQTASFSTIPGAPYTDVVGGPDGRVWVGGQKQPGNQTAVIALGVGPGPFGIDATIPIAGAGTAGVGDVAPGPDGNVWFTVPGANRVGFANAAGVGTATSFDLGLTSAAAGQPMGITTGGDGALWFTKVSPGAIVRMTPNGTVTNTFTAADGLDPAAQPLAITLGPDGNVWFTDAAADRAGRITPAGVITMFPAVKSVDLIAGPDGNLWLGGGSTLSTAGVFTPRTLPADTLAVGADGNVWGAKPGTAAVSRLALGGQQFSNPARMTVPATGASGAADLYPSPITVSGLLGTVTKVTVRLNGVHHRFANDLQVLLAGPGGQSTVLMANVTTRPGDLNTQPYSLTGESIAFTSGGREPARRITSGVFSPIDPGFALSFTAPAPAAPSGGLAQFAGTPPNGTWKLFVVDSEGTAATTGAIAGGWSLDVETSGPPAVTQASDEAAVPTAPAPAGTGGEATPRDTTPPSLRVTGVPRRTTLKALRRGLRLRVTPSEPLRVTATVAIRTRRGGFGPPLASRTLDLSAATPLRLAPRIAGRPSRTFTAQVRLVAVDRSGNRATTVLTITVRP